MLQLANVMCMLLPGCVHIQRAVPITVNAVYQGRVEVVPKRSISYKAICQVRTQLYHIAWHLHSVHCSSRSSARLVSALSAHSSAKPDESVDDGGAAPDGALQP